MTPSIRRRHRFQPGSEPCEARFLLSTASPRVQAQAAARSGILRSFGAEHPVRPNRPVTPFGQANATAGFIDPTVLITSPDRIAVGRQIYIAPYANLDATGGSIRVGNVSSILDNARIDGSSGVTIGAQVVIGPGVQITGATTIGADAPAAMPTYIGPNAIIDGATISAGSAVSPLARIGPGVTVPAGVLVLPGAVITTNAEASDPALGQVVPLPASDRAAIATLQQNNVLLATGYATLYQGNSATGFFNGAGAQSGTTANNVYNGNLAAVSGVSAEPGTTTVRFEPSAATPRFLSGRGKLVAATDPAARARLIGGLVFNDRPANVLHNLGRGVSIRGDQGQPLTFGRNARVGNNVTITSPLAGLVSATTPTTGTSAGTTTGGTTTGSGTGSNSGTGTGSGNGSGSGGTGTGTGSSSNGTSSNNLGLGPGADNGAATGGSGSGSNSSGATGSSASATNGRITVGTGLIAGDGSQILGGPAAATNLGNDVTLGARAVVVESTLGAGARIGAGAYVLNSTVPAGAVIAPGTILVDNQIRRVAPV